MYEGARAEPVLAASGITTDGHPVQIALDAGPASPLTRIQRRWDANHRSAAAATVPHFDVAGQLS